VKRALALLGAALLLTLLAGHLLRETPGYMVRNPDGSFGGDLNHYVYWTRLVTLGGIESAYSGTWPETYAVYPPITLYPFQVVGALYRATQDPAFDALRAQDSLFLRAAIKFAALAWHLLTGIAIFVLVRRWLAAEVLAAVAATVYLLDPATLYDVAHWAQPDGAHSLFSVLAVGLLSLNRVAGAWAALALAALAKPQAWSIGPLFALATLRLHSWPGLGRGLLCGAATGLAVILPFVVTGQLDQLFSLPLTVSTVMPVATADAHNAWWLVTASRG